MQLRTTFVVYLYIERSEKGAKGTPRTLRSASIFGKLFSLRKKFAKTKKIHFDVFSLPTSLIPLQSILMGSKLRFNSFSKPNQCCPFLHSFVPLTQYNQTEVSPSVSQFD